jgi:hypothetical protein
MKSFFELIHNYLFQYQRWAGLILSCSDAPDTSGMNRAAEANAEVAREALAWYKKKTP